MPREKIDATKALLISIIIVLAVSAAALFYNNKKLNELNKDFTARLLLLNKEIVENLNALQQDLERDIASLSNNLTLEMELIESGLNSFRKKNEQDITALSELIDEIERQSDIKLEELKDEISTIQVESGDFSAIVDDVIKSAVSVGTNRGQGSGVVVDDRGFIVTNHHVVEGASLIRVLAYDGEVYDAGLIGYNEVVDLAVLKVDADLEALRYGDSDDVKVGERVIALGNPAGLSFTVTEGIVSAVDRVGPNGLSIYIQTDVPINPGNSGGPLVNANSRIVGINNFKVGGFESLGFAIESNSVRDVTDDIIGQYLAQIGQ